MVTVLGDITSSVGFTR